MSEWDQSYVMGNLTRTGDLCTAYRCRIVMVYTWKSYNVTYQVYLN